MQKNNLELGLFFTLVLKDVVLLRRLMLRQTHDTRDTSGKPKSKSNSNGKRRTTPHHICFCSTHFMWVFLVLVRLDSTGRHGWILKMHQISHFLGPKFTNKFSRDQHWWGLWNNPFEKKILNVAKTIVFDQDFRFPKIMSK